MLPLQTMALKMQTNSHRRNYLLQTTALKMHTNPHRRNYLLQTMALTLLLLIEYIRRQVWYWFENTLFVLQHKIPEFPVVLYRETMLLMDTIFCNTLIYQYSHHLIYQDRISRHRHLNQNIDLFYPTNMKFFFVGDASATGDGVDVVTKSQQVDFLSH